MYRENMLKISKITNGFLIEVRAPYKELPEGEKKDAVPYTMHGEKEIYARDAADLGNKIMMLIPMLEEEFESEDAFEEAFEEMAKQ